VTVSQPVVVRPDSGAACGLGHVQRCLALASALGERGVGCTFLVPEAMSVQARIRRAGFSVRELDDANDPEELIAAAEGGSAVVVDSYCLGEDFLRALHEASLVAVVLDDLAAFPIRCHLCVNGGAGAEALPYRATNGDTRFLLGLRYTIIRPELWDSVGHEPAETVSDVLVTLGSSDPHHLAPALLQGLDAIEAEFSVKLIVGPYFRDRRALAQTAAACGRLVTLLDAPPSLVPFMHTADLAISAAGQTVYELMRLAVPTVAIEIAENQRIGLEALAAAGAVRAPGRATDPELVPKVARATADLVDEVSARRALAHTAGALLDGNGARRVAGAICELLSLRPSLNNTGTTPTRK